MRPYFRKKFLVYAGIPVALLLGFVALYYYRPLRSITVFTFPGYLTPEIKERFTREHHIRVVEKTFMSNQEMMAHLKVGWTEYDVVIPSNYVVDDLRRRRLLRRLDPARIPNMQRFNPLLEQFLPPDYINYAAPYAWTTLSIAYRAGAIAVPPTNWAEFFAKPNTFVAPTTSVLLEKRETMGLALMALGFPPDSTDPKELAALRTLMLEFKDRGVVISLSPVDDILAGRAALCLDWTSNILRAMKQDPNLRNVVPTGPTLMVLDNLAIPTTSRQPHLAERFIDFLLRPDLAAAQAEEGYFLTSADATSGGVPGHMREAIMKSFERGELVPISGFSGNEERTYDVIWAEFGAHHH